MLGNFSHAMTETNFKNEAFLTEKDPFHIDLVFNSVRRQQTLKNRDARINSLKCPLCSKIICHVF